EVNAFRAIREFWQILPDFLASEGHDGSEQANQSLADAPDGGLRAAAGLRLRGKDIEPIFEHIEIKCAQVHDAEMIHPVVDLVEGKIVVRGAYVFGENRGLAQHVPIETFHLIERDHIVSGVEVAEIAQDVAEGIANL